MILCVELAVLWLIYLCFGWLVAFEMPLWLSTFLVIGVDRTTSWVEEMIQSWRESAL